MQMYILLKKEDPQNHTLPISMSPIRLKYLIILPQIDYEQSLVPLRDSRGKRTSEQARKSSVSLKGDACVEPLVTFQHGRRFRASSLVRFPRLSLSGKRDCS